MTPTARKTPWDFQLGAELGGLHPPPSNWPPKSTTLDSSKPHIYLGVHIFVSSTLEKWPQISQLSEDRMANLEGDP